MSEADSGQDQSVWLHELWSADADRYLERNDTVLLPVGSLEQHGAHLAMGCDTFTARGVVEDAARAAGVLAAPPVWYGWSEHHLEITGTVSLRAETLTALVTDIGESLAGHGFRQLVIVNGHRFTNVPPLAIAATTITTRTPMLAVVADLGYMAGEVYRGEGDDVPAGDLAHGDAYETAHMLHLNSSMVHLEAAPPAAGDGFDPLAAVDPWNPSLRAAYWPIRAEEVVAAPTGGDPRSATAERGEQLHRALVQDLVRLIISVKAANVRHLRRGGDAAPSGPGASE